MKSRITSAVVGLLVGLCGSAWGGTAVYTGSSDAVQLVDPNVAYAAQSLSIIGGPTASAPPRGELVNVVLPGGLASLPAGDVTFEMKFTPGQTPTTNISDAGAPSGANCGIQFTFASGTLAVAWGASFNVYTVAAVFFPANPGQGVVAQASSPVTTDLRAIRMVRTGNSVAIEYDTASSTITLNTVNLAAAGSQSVNVSNDTVSYAVVSANTFGSVSNAFSVDEVRVCGPNIPTVNNGTGECSGAEGEGEGEGEGEVVCPTALSAGCPNFALEGVPFYTLLDGFIPGPPVTWALTDLTQNGIIDSWEAALFENVLCSHQPWSDDALCAYELNLATLNTEGSVAGPPFSGFKKVIALLQTMNSESQAATGSLNLQGNYRIAGAGAKANGEPFSAQGDLDGDGLSNLEEYQNVINANLTMDDYVAAATNPLLDGTASVDSLPLAGVLGLLTTTAALGLVGRRQLRRK